MTDTPSTAYETQYGKMLEGTIENVLQCGLLEPVKGKVNLVFTSPPFPLRNKKSYGNLTGEAYLEWLESLSMDLADLLTSDGSIVMEIGNCWEPGKPLMSTLPLQALLRFLSAGRLNLCQLFVAHNPARLPGPAQWVNIERCRVKDSYTNLWWMSPSEKPKASNRHVLVDYSPAMRSLLRRQDYNRGRRPSGHVVTGDSFLNDNGGAIPSNVIVCSNTSWNDRYREYCRERNLDLHPARMPAGIAEFFIRFLTDEGDLVLDPFGGSNTTGAVAERLCRHWISIESDSQFVAGSRGRFDDRS